MLKALIFDFDGVIHDTLGLSFEITRKYIPGITHEQFKGLFDGNIHEHPEITPTRANKFFEDFEKRLPELHVEDSTKNVLLSLSKTYSLFIITSNRERVLDSYLKINGISTYFAETFGVESHRSKVEKFLLLMKKHHLTKNECLFITDTLGDILEANKVGIKTIAVTSGYHERERLEKGKPYQIISSITELSLVLHDGTK